MSVSVKEFRFATPRLTNFYYSFLFLPREKRRAIDAVYAFARRGDDIVDSGLAPDEAGRQIACYRKALDACYNQQSAALQEPELAALSESIREFKIPRQPFEDLILGLEMDLNGARYETFDDLSLYCYRVASTIGLISIEIFGYANPQDTRLRCESRQSHATRQHPARCPKRRATRAHLPSPGGPGPIWCASRRTAVRSLQRPLSLS